MALPIDAFEFDVWLSRDKVPVIMHDGNARRTTGVDRHLRDMTLEEIKALDAGGLFDPAFRGEKVPSLREVLNLVKETRPSLRLGVEIKEYTEETVDIAVPAGTYDYYDEIGLDMNIVKSEVLPFYQAKGMPIHMYCADTREDVELCLREGASLITANDPLPLIEVLREKGIL